MFSDVDSASFVPETEESANVGQSGGYESDRYESARCGSDRCGSVWCGPDRCGSVWCRLDQSLTI